MHFFLKYEWNSPHKNVIIGNIWDKKCIGLIAEQKCIDSIAE